jgi:lambda family phage portal protein
MLPLDVRRVAASGFAGSMGMIANFGAAVSGATSKLAFFGRGNSGHEAGRHNVPELQGWNPGTTYSDNDNRGTRDAIVGRAQDLDANNGWVHGALDRRVEAVVGGRIRLSSQPKYDLLGQDYAWRMKWTGNVQSLFTVWSNDVHRRCDARKQLNFGAMVRLAYLQYVRDGEVCAEVRMSSRGARFSTNIKLIDSDRLSNPQDRQNTKAMRNGVEYDSNGAPLAYHVQKRHPQDMTADWEARQWERIPAFTSRTGKAKFIHVFNPRRIEQSRGVSRLAEAVVPSKMLDVVDREEVKAAIKSAMLSIFIQSPAPTSELQGAVAPDGKQADWSDGYLGDMLAYREEKPFRQPNTHTGHLLPGEEVIVPAATHPNANYEVFQSTILRKIASSIGISYPQLSQDWAGINYSSARALLNEMWRSFLQDRDFFTQAFCTPIYAAWMEEAVARGEIEVPGGAAQFYRLKTELTLCEWVGPGRGSVDPLKEANANNLDTAAGRVSTVELVSERNRDIEDVMSETQWHLNELQRRGLSEPNHNTKAAAEGEDGGGAAGTEEDRDGDGIPQEGKTKKPAQGDDE